MSFLPSDLSGLWGWYKADGTVIVAGGPNTVNSWNDDSGNGHHLVSESGKEPRYVASSINSKPALKNNIGAVASMVTAANLPSGNHTIFIVGAQHVAANPLSDSGGAWLGTDTDSILLWRELGSPNFISANSFPVIKKAAVNDTFYSIRFRNDGSNQYLTLNNDTEVSTAISANAAAPVYLFNDSSNDYGNKSIAEVIIFTRALNSFETSQVENYLQQKYNLPYSVTISLNPNNMSLTKIDSNKVALFISEDIATPVWKEIVCAESHSLSGSKDINKRKTKTCGTIVSSGSTDWTLSGSGVASSTPDSDELSVDDLLTSFQSGDTIKWKLEDRDTPANYHREGKGVFTSHKEDAPEGEVLSFDYEIAVQGDITI